MTLEDIIKGLDRPLVTGSLAVDVSSVTADSRHVKENMVFVAIRGLKSDGRRYISSAIEAGATVVVSDSAPADDEGTTVTWIQVNDPRAALSTFAAQLAGKPSLRLKLIGVTGTNGKTTTAFLCHHLLKKIWHRAGLLGSVVMDDGEEVMSSVKTTPDPIALHGFLRKAVDNGCRGVALEVSSHGIHQRRVADLIFKAMIFTNLTQDHLDYHGTMERYAAVKFSWFEAATLSSNKKKPVAVINADDIKGTELIEKLDGKLSVIRYGFGQQADYRALDFRQTSRGMEFKLLVPGRSHLVRAPLIGRFNVYNILASLAAAKAVGIPLRDAVAAIGDAPQVPGRMEHCGTRDGISVFVDYAHTPDALANACRTLKELEPKRLIVVFGCGGDRDRSKRPLMGQAAANNSDICILTSDNPRSEDPEAIINEIESGMGQARYKRVTDRAEAIRIAVHAAGSGDIVLIAGKGHETYQQFADTSIDFDDRRQAKTALNERPDTNSPV